MDRSKNRMDRRGCALLLATLTRLMLLIHFFYSIIRILPSTELRSKTDLLSAEGRTLIPADVKAKPAGRKSRLPEFAKRQRTLALPERKDSLFCLLPLFLHSLGREQLISSADGPGFPCAGSAMGSLT
ncbi:hypothetical protein BON23_3259 [Saccharomyces cerevisiae]|nr:hypothetical protein BON23_3259 [Saccharomyces cerevisiae]